MLKSPTQNYWFRSGEFNIIPTSANSYATASFQLLGIQDLTVVVESSIIHMSYSSILSGNLTDAY